MTMQDDNQDDQSVTVAVEPDDEIILARRRMGFGVVSIDVGMLIERAPGWTVPQRLFDTGYVEAGDLIPMRRGEAEGRIDFEVASSLDEET